MTFRVELKESCHEFEVQNKETILEAGLRDGLNLPHSCMNGSCGECTARLLEGKVAQCRNHDFRLTEVQKQQGFFLTCCYNPVSDLLLDMHELQDAIELPYQEVKAKVVKLEQLQDEVMQLYVKTARSKLLEFLAGQQVIICCPDGTCVQLGIASCPCDGINLRFHIRLGNDEFSQRVFSQLKKGTQLLLKGPIGELTLNEASERPLIFIASETGFAQVQSLIDHVISINPDREMDLYWLSAIHRGHYLSNYCRMWRDVLDNFRYQSIDLKPMGEMTFKATLELMSQLQTNLTSADIYAVLPDGQLRELERYLDNLGFPCEQLRTEQI